MRRVSMSLAVLIVALLATARAGHASMEIPADDPPGGGCNSGSVPLELRSPTPTLTTTEDGICCSQYFEVRPSIPYSSMNGAQAYVARTDDNTEAMIYDSAWNSRVETKTLYFNSGNWYNWQRIDVIGVSDCDKDGDQNTSITVTNQLFPGCPVTSIGVKNQDVATASLQVTPGSASTDETGTVVTLSARVVPKYGCSGPPTTSVRISSADTSEGLVKAPNDPAPSYATTLDFSAAESNTWKAFQVKGLRDGIPDGNVTYAVDLSSTSQNTAFDGLTTRANITNIDVAPAANTCFTRCGQGIDSVGAPPAGCSCTADCAYQGNCCPDVTEECSGIAGTPAYPNPLAFGAGSEFYTFSPTASTAASTSSDAPQGTGAIVSFDAPVVANTRAFAGLTKISQHKVATHEERGECRVWNDGSMWQVRSWVNWALNPDAYVECSSRALVYPRNSSSPPVIRQTAAAQDVGAQSPQTVDMGAATATSMPVLTAIKVENIGDATHARCLTSTSGGNWNLTAEGSASVSDVWCNAEVLSWTASSGLVAGPEKYAGADWTTPAPGERETYLGFADNRACFLSGVNYVSNAPYGGGGGTCEIKERNDGLYLIAKRDTPGALIGGVGCYARCVEFTNSWPEIPTLRGVVGPGETPAASTDVGVAGSTARTNLYQHGAYDRPLVLVEGVDPTNSSGPSKLMRMLSPAIRALAQNHGVDLWIVNVSGQADIRLTAREVARAIGNAYTFDPDGAGPLQAWNVANPGRKVALAGFSQGALDARVSVASWESGLYAATGSEAIPGLPVAAGPPPISVFLSVNGPQDGAEAPLSLQHVVHDVDASLADAGLSMPPDVTALLDSTPARQMLRHQGCSNAWGVVTEWCGVLGMIGNRIVQGPYVPAQAFVVVDVTGSDACVGQGDYPTFMQSVNTRGRNGNGFPATVPSIGFSNGSFSPQGCANRDANLRCSGPSVAWATGLFDGSVFSSAHFVFEGDALLGACKRNSKLYMRNTIYDLAGGDLAPGRIDMVNRIPNVPKEVTLLKGEEYIPSLFIPTESALTCPGTAANSSCTALDAFGRRDHNACDQLCRSANRNPASPKFHNVFSNPANTNGQHTSLHADLGSTLLAYAYEYVVADADGAFSIYNPYLRAGQIPAGENDDCDDSNPSVQVCGVELPPEPDPDPVLRNPLN